MPQSPTLYCFFDPILSNMPPRILTVQLPICIKCKSMASLQIRACEPIYYQCPYDNYDGTHKLTYVDFYYDSGKPYPVDDRDIADLYVKLDERNTQKFTHRYY